MVLPAWREVTVLQATGQVGIKAAALIPRTSETWLNVKIQNMLEPNGYTNSVKIT